MVFINMMNSENNVPDEMREITRLKFMLDQSNRYPGFLDIHQIKKYSLRLDSLERKMRK
ncbi:MAG: hypothetical protein KAS12_07345 [Candidatus Aenigmarchaeota archaeon]|nr:hypothetical protein [Candidatus Aenigmarchaeota archaeon]